MSGGAYNYASTAELYDLFEDHIDGGNKLDSLREMIDEMLSYCNDTHPDEIIQVAEITEKIIQQLETLANQVGLKDGYIDQLEDYVHQSGLREIWRTVEYIASFDCGEDDLRTLLNKFKKGREELFKFPLPFALNYWQSPDEIIPEEDDKYLVIDYDGSLQLAIYIPESDEWVEHKLYFKLVPKLIAKINLPEVI